MTNNAQITLDITDPNVLSEGRAIIRYQNKDYHFRCIYPSQSGWTCAYISSFIAFSSITNKATVEWEDLALAEERILRRFAEMDDAYIN